MFDINTKSRVLATTSQLLDDLREELRNKSIEVYSLTVKLDNKSQILEATEDALDRIKAHRDSLTKDLQLFAARNEVLTAENIRLETIKAHAAKKMRSLFGQVQVLKKQLVDETKNYHAAASYFAEERDVTNSLRAQVAKLEYTTLENNIFVGGLRLAQGKQIRDLIVHLDVDVDVFMEEFNKAAALAKEFKARNFEFVKFVESLGTMPWHQDFVNDNIRYVLSALDNNE
jgi:hypothetical protein